MRSFDFETQWVGSSNRCTLVGVPQHHFLFVLVATHIEPVVEIRGIPKQSTLDIYSYIIQASGVHDGLDMVRRVLEDDVRILLALAKRLTDGRRIVNTRIASSFDFASFRPWSPFTFLEARVRWSFLNDFRLPAVVFSEILAYVRIRPIWFPMVFGSI